MNALIHAIDSGDVTSPETRTSSSPETPVAFCSSSTDCSAGRSEGTSWRMSLTTFVPVPATQPVTASTVAIASTRPGVWIDAASALWLASEAPRRIPARIEPAPLPAPAAERAAAPRRPLSARARSRPPARKDPARGVGREAIESAASPAVSEIARAAKIPATSESANSRTIGIGESVSERKPAAVASAAVPITGPPRTAAITAAAGGRSPLSAASRKRACNWIA